MKLIVKNDSILLDYLLNNTDYTKSKLKSLFKFKNITINGKVPSGLNIEIKKNAVLEVSKEIKNTMIDTIPIVYEDKDYLVVNKPGGMLTISTDKEKNRTLYHKVYEYVHSKKSGEKIFIVHRLDRETSGLVLFCKNEKLRDMIQENWEDVAVLREYHAVVSGILTKKKDKLVNFLKETKDNRVVISKDGKKAITNYEVVKEDKNSLLKINIETGRKNQIRAQLANIGYPIIGDTKYNGLKDKKMYLCANKLCIKDIKTKKILSFELNLSRDYMKKLSS